MVEKLCGAAAADSSLSSSWILIQFLKPCMHLLDHQIQNCSATYEAPGEKCALWTDHQGTRRRARVLWHHKNQVESFVRHKERDVSNGHRELSIQEWLHSKPLSFSWTAISIRRKAHRLEPVVSTLTHTLNMNIVSELWSITVNRHVLHKSAM